MAVAVALGPALGAGLTVLGAAHRVGIGRQQGVDHGLQQTAHQVRGGLSQSLVKGSSRVDNVRSGHRDDVLSRIRWKVDSKDHTVTAPTTNTRASHRRLHHTTGHYPFASGAAVSADLWYHPSAVKHLLRRAVELARSRYGASFSLDGPSTMVEDIIDAHLGNEWQSTDVKSNGVHLGHPWV